MPKVTESTLPEVKGLTSLSILFLQSTPTDLLTDYPQRCAKWLKVKVVTAHWHQYGERCWVEAQIRYDTVLGQRRHHQRFRYTDIAPHPQYLIQAIERALTEARALAMVEASRETA